MTIISNSMNKQASLSVQIVDSIRSVVEPMQCRSNYWLQALMLNTHKLHQRDPILQTTNKEGSMTRPVWRLMRMIVAFANCPRMNLADAELIAQRLINTPSSPYI